MVLLSLILYSVAAKRYRYRMRNELADINEKVIIAQHHARYLDEKEKSSSRESIFIDSK